MQSLTESHFGDWGRVSAIQRSKDSWFIFLKGGEFNSYGRRPRHLKRLYYSSYCSLYSWGRGFYTFTNIWPLSFTSSYRPSTSCFYTQIKAVCSDRIWCFTDSLTTYAFWSTTFAYDILTYRSESPARASSSSLSRRKWAIRSTRGSPAVLGST